MGMEDLHKANGTGKPGKESALHSWFVKERNELHRQEAVLIDKVDVQINRRRRQRTGGAFAPKDSVIEQRITKLWNDKAKIKQKYEGLQSALIMRRDLQKERNKEVCLACLRKLDKEESRKSIAMYHVWKPLDDANCARRAEQARNRKYSYSAPGSPPPDSNDANSGGSNDARFPPSPKPPSPQEEEDMSPRKKASAVVDAWAENLWFVQELLKYENLVALVQDKIFEGGRKVLLARLEEYKKHKQYILFQKNQNSNVAIKQLFKKVFSRTFHSDRCAAKFFETDDKHLEEAVAEQLKQATEKVFQVVNEKKDEFLKRE